jgi:PPIC-type PPIASE domain
MRRLVAPVALVVAVLLLFGCSDSGGGSDAGSTAVTANSAKIPTDLVVSELRTIAGNQRLVKWYKDQDFNLVPRQDTIDPDTAAFWVNTLTQGTFIDREFARRKLEVDPQGRDAAREKVSQIFGGLKVFAGFPRQFQETLIRRQLRLEALQTALGPIPPATEADLQALFAAVQKQCPTGKLLSQTWNPTRAKAEAIVAEVAAGTDFATVAQQRSDDEVTKSRGGRLTCIGAAQYNQYDPSIRTAAEALPLGGTSAPIAGKGGYYVFHVDPMTLENMRPLLETEYVRKTVTPLAAFLSREMQQANPLKVNPRFAKVVRVTNSTAIAPVSGPVDLS